MIQLFHLYKTYGDDAPALADITVEIEKGELVYLTGPSGAGKSTLLRLLFAAERPTRGQLLVNGWNMVRLRPSAVPYLRRNIGVVFQDFKLLARRSVQDNVAITLEVLGLPRRTIQTRVFRILEEVGLGHKRHELPPRLSGGEQQRAAIARALVNEPLILLADEPTGSLDAEQADRIMQLLERANTRGTTVVVATHDRALLERGHRRVLRLEEGRLRRS